jgi:hypothetical protein
VVRTPHRKEKQKLLQFDKDTHIYKRDGQRLLSVTQVLPDIPEHLHYQQFFIDKTLLGSRVHETIDAINKQILKTGKTPAMKAYLRRHEQFPQDTPYLDAYAKFIKDLNPCILYSEAKLSHPVWTYAGTIDMIAHLFKKTYVVDVKTSVQIAPYARLQLAAYQAMYNHNQIDKGQLVEKRAILQLKPDGSYKFEQYAASGFKADFDIFLCKLKSVQWDRANGLS